MLTNNIVVLVHGRHLQTSGWEKLVWGDGEKIGTAPLGLYLAVKYQARIVFGTGGSERDGLKECAYTVKYLHDHLAQLSQFPEFSSTGSLKDVKKLESLIDEAVLDADSQNTEQEILNALNFCKSIGATVLIQVTSPAHVARCANTTAKQANLGYDFRGLIPMIVSARSSTENYRATNTVVFEYPHRGDDQSPNLTDVLPKIFKIPLNSKVKFKDELNSLIEKYIS